MEYLSLNICEENGRLLFGNVDVCDLAKQYGTPLYLMDENRIRAKCRTYLEAFKEYFPAGSLPFYASKACSFKQLYRIVKDEGLGTDVVSIGELLTAKEAGFNLENVCFHGNNKTDNDIEMAIQNGVGFFVVDNKEELDSINEIALAHNIRQKILIRLTPGIDPHTYDAVATGKVDSKFGVAIETGQAQELVCYALTKSNINLRGFHCHVGSQVFEEDVFERAAVIMLEFIASMKTKYSFVAEYLNMGGGFGVRYVESDPEIDITKKIKSIAEVINKTCEDLAISVPKIMMEPGRSIVADAGMTLYTVGSLKKIPGYKTYVSVDGGMADNPRYALYKSKYTCLLANKVSEDYDMECTIAGRCCESGDLIQENVMLPSSVARGDLLAVCTTGAYNYAMSSNYNRLPRPAVVMLRDCDSYIAVKRETFEDLMRNDC